MAGADLKKCPECKKSFDITKEEFVKVNRRYVHPECYQKNKAHYDRLIQQYQKKESQLKKVDEKLPKNSDLPAPKKTPKMMKCFYCGGQVDIANEPFGKPRVNRYAHKGCMEQNYDPDERYIDMIYSYLKEEVGISYDYLLCEKQRLSYISKNGYTNEGILKTLKYFYGVQKGSPEKSGNRIGIVPFLYQEAQQYFNTLEQRQKDIKKAGEKQKKVNTKIIEVSTPDIEVRRPHINLESLEG